MSGVTLLRCNLEDTNSVCLFSTLCKITAGYGLENQASTGFELMPLVMLVQNPEFASR